MAKQFTLRDDPKFREADDKLQKLCAKRGELQTQIDELVSNRAAAVENYHTAMQSRADALLGNDDSAVATLPPKTADDIGFDLGVKRDQLAVLVLAIKTQSNVIAKLGQEISQRVCKEARPEYVAHVKRIHAAIKELAEANDAERAFRESMTDGGIAFLSYFRPPALGIEWSLTCHTGFQPRALERLQEIELDFPELRGTIYRRRQLDVPGWG